jgi:hypothetical protein
MTSMATPNHGATTARAKRYAIAVAIALGAGATGWIGWRLSNARATPPAEPAAANPGALATNTQSAPAAPAEPVAETATITFTTVPPSNATVTWGKAMLGRIAPRQALVIVRPRDSGPLDVIVRAAGYLPVHTRAHTFADTTVSVKLTRPDQKDTLFGYRAPLDAGTPEEEAQPASSTGVEAPPF